MKKRLETVIFTSLGDSHKLYGTVDNLLMNVTDIGNIIVVGCSQVEDELKSIWTKRVSFMDESDIISLDDVTEYYRAIVPEGGNSPGWYYQQFLKLAYSSHTNSEYYLTWDADTSLVRKHSFFDEEADKPIFDMKVEYHKPYFNTIKHLFGDIDKINEGSFVSEHMVYNTKRTQEMLAEIINNEKLVGDTFWKKIFNAASVEELRVGAAFSEFETYGSWMETRYPGEYSLRKWTSLRHAINYYPSMEKALRDAFFLAKEYDAISLEDGHSSVKYIMTPWCLLFWNPLFKHFWKPTQMFKFLHDRGIAYWPGEKEEYRKNKKKKSII